MNLCNYLSVNIYIALSIATIAHNYGAETIKMEYHETGHSVFPSLSLLQYFPLSLLHSADTCSVHAY